MDMETEKHGKKKTKNERESGGAKSWKAKNEIIVEERRKDDANAKLKP